jgi:hypothetical protein
VTGMRASANQSRPTRWQDTSSIQTPLLGESSRGFEVNVPSVQSAALIGSRPSGDEILTERLGDRLGTIASSQFLLGFPKMTSHGLRPQPQRCTRFGHLMTQ